jgi:hypothetical protein
MESHDGVEDRQDLVCDESKFSAAAGAAPSVAQIVGRESGRAGGIDGVTAE